MLNDSQMAVFTKLISLILILCYGHLNLFSYLLLLGSILPGGDGRDDDRAEKKTGIYRSRRRLLQHSEETQNTRFHFNEGLFCFPYAIATSSNSSVPLF